MADEIKPELECEILKIIGSLAEECLISKLDFALEEVTDFEKIMTPSKGTIEEKLIKIIKLLQSSQSFLSGSEILSSRSKVSLVSLIILVGEQHDCNKPWSAKAITSKICTIAAYIHNWVINSNHGHAGVIETVEGESNNATATTQGLVECLLLDLQSAVSPRKSLFFLCLQFLRPKLKRDVWKCYPAAVTAFTWLLNQIKYPYLSDFVGDVLSPSLLFADDYNDDIKIQGISCLGHAIQNLNKGDLLKENWGSVLYNAFIGMSHEKNPVIIEKFMPLLITILKVIEVDPNSKSHIFTKYDECMKKIIFAIECCSERNLKLSWVNHLSLFLEEMGHATLHWHNRICEILLPMTTVNEPLLWKSILKCLQVCIRNTWLKPDSPSNAEIILRLLLNCSVLDFPNISKTERLSIIQLSKETFELMSSCSDFEIVKDQIDAMRANSQFHPDFINVLLNL